MKRTQILVKEEQHIYFIQQAEVNNTSISDIVRKMIDEKMAETMNKQSQGGIKMAELAADGSEDYKNHDEDLY